MPTETEQKVHLARAQPVPLVKRAQRVQRVRLVALERLVLVAQVLRELPALGELAVQLEALALMEQKVHLARA